MSIPEQYLVTTKNVDAFFNSIINAQPPKKFTLKFLEQLEFKSTNDRLLIGVLKALRFIDAEGVPQSRYYEFIDQTRSKRVMAEAIKDAYSDLFAVNLKANESTVAEVKNKLKTILQGSKSDNVVSLMANTFVALCAYADFSTEAQAESYASNTTDVAQGGAAPADRIEREGQQNSLELVRKQITTEMHYNIQIHLPESRDVAVFDAIFKTLKEHLL